MREIGTCKECKHGLVFDATVVLCVNLNPENPLSEFDLSPDFGCIYWEQQESEVESWTKSLDYE